MTESSTAKVQATKTKRSFLRRVFSWRTLTVLVLLIALSPAVLIFGCTWLIRANSSPYINEDVTQVPAEEVVLVLGTSPRTSTGARNLHFKERMEAAARLFDAGKVKYILLSGDNRSENYNEPKYMREALISAGVPPAYMYPDYAGLRTLDSVLRAKEVFGLQKLIIISDGFHLPRAIFLARHFGLEAYGYPAHEVELANSARSRLREYAANVKAVLDVFVLETQPRHLGPKFTIPSDALSEEWEAKPKRPSTQTESKAEVETAPDEVR